MLTLSAIVVLARNALTVLMKRVSFKEELLLSIFLSTLLLVICLRNVCARHLTQSANIAALNLSTTSR
jgi:hypothetical protein